MVRSSDFGAWLASRRGPVYLIVPQAGRAQLERVAGNGVTIEPLGPGYWGAVLAAADQY